jgi:hypothetical protein
MKQKQDDDVQNDLIFLGRRIRLARLVNHASSVVIAGIRASRKRCNDVKVQVVTVLAGAITKNNCFISRR